MKRKFTLLLMALLALAGFKSWGQETITVDFESGIPSGWTLIDADGDGHNWQIETEKVHGGSKALSSASYDNGYAYTPDNYFISPKLSIQDDASMSFYAESYLGWSEPFSVLVSTTGTSTSDFTAIQTWNPFTTNPFTQLNVDLSDYAGQEIHIAFRHNGSTGEFRLIIDDITIDLGTSSTKYDITYVNDGVAEHGTFGGPARAAEDATVTLTATPDEGYQLEPDSWVVTKSTGGTVDVTNNQFTMPACDVTVSATFTELPRYTVNVTNPTNGVNTTATLSATPNTGVLKDTEVRLSYSDLAEGYKFLNYVATNANTSESIAIQQGWDNGSYSYFIMPNANVNLTASVKKIRTINVAEMQHGSLSISPNPQYQQIAAGETITISPNPDYGYAMGTLTITKVSGGTITPEQTELWGETVYTFEMPEDNVNIDATFTATGTLYTVTLPEETEIGGVSARNADTWESSTEYFADDNVCIYGSVYNSNYYLKDIVVKKNSDQTVVDFYGQSGNYYYFVMPDDNVTVTATFEEKPRYTVNIPAFTGGTVTASETSVMANTMVYLDYAANDGYTFAGITIKKDSDMSEVYYYDGSWYGHSYYFYMPEGNVTVNAMFNELPHFVTVFPNTTTTNQYIPFNGYYTDVQKSKSQFIIPKAELQEMKDGKIINLTLYTNFNNSFTGTWNIYVMEVADGTTLSSSYVSLDGVDPVYFGNLTASSNELSVEITPYPYQGGNLLVCFDQTSQGNCSQNNSLFYGVSASYGASRYTYYSNQNSSNFLPKTTFTYTPAVKYNITIDDEMENGTVLASAESAAEGETITLTPQPEAGYGLTAWNVTTTTGSVIVDENNQFTMPASDVTVSATFDLLDRYTVTVNQPTEGATLSVNPTADWYEGLEVRLNCELTEGYQFGGWIVTSESTTLDVLHNDSENYDYFVMPAADVTVTATINKVYAISIAPTENGEIYTYPANNAAVGTYVQVDAYPAEGYYLESLLITDQSGEVEHDAYNRFIMPASDVTVTATFSNAHYSITLNEPENGTLTANVEDLTDVFPTSLITITATPATHYHLLSLTIMANGQEVPVLTHWDDYYQIQMPIGNVEVTATFEENDKYTVSLVYNEEGGSIALQGGNTEYYAGDAVYVYFYPETGYILYSIEAEDSNQTPVSMSKYSTSYKFDMPEDDVTVTAEFVRGITVNDGSNTNNYVPFYGYYANYGLTKSQFIIPETNLGALQYNIINGLVFYASAPQNQTFSGSWDVYIKNLPATTTTLNGYVALGEMDEKVYTGSMVIADNKMIVTFDEPVQYNYGNLLICFDQTSYASSASTSWYGVNQSSNTAYAGYNYYGDYSQARQFLPKVTFLYEPGEPLPEYTITFHSNGVESEQILTEGQSLPAPTNIPAGLTFAGWATEDIETYYNEEQAEQIEYVTAARVEEDLYAVFSYGENETTSKGAGTWTKVTDVNELANNDKVVFVYNNYIMSQRYSGYYSYSVASVSIENGVITNIPDDAIEFTLVKNGDNWKLQYFDNAETPNIGETTLAYTGYDLVPHNFFSYTYPDTWTAVNNANAVNFKETECEYTRYIAYNSNQIKGNSNNPCQVYKASAPVVTHYYYMTEVLTNGSITANTTAKNIIITTGTVTVNDSIVLTMDENGLFRNENAAHFVFGYGAQLITDNTGVIATFKKHINGNDWYTISSPLAADETAFADVTNLIPSSGVTGTDYDLYRLNEAKGIWENARVNEGVAFTTIDKGRGYLYANATGIDHIAFAGEVNVADVECTLTNSVTNGFNLIGNPFMQNIKLTDVESDGTAELADGFYVLNNDESWGTEPITTGTIAPLQGFLVQATTAGNVTIRKPSAPGKGERSEQSTNIEMIVSNSIYRDNAFAMFGEGIGLNKVNHRNAQAPMLYVPQDGEKFAIAFMDENTTVFPLNFKAMTTGNYSISLKATDDINTLVLVDNMTGVETNMLLEGSYSFIGSPADNDSRFTVKLSISHNNGQADNEHFVYQNGSELVVNGEGTLQIFDVLGRVVVSEEVHGQTVYVGNLSTGAYIVRMTGENVRTQKIVLK